MDEELAAEAASGQTDVLPKTIADDAVRTSSEHGWENSSVVLDVADPVRDFDMKLESSGVKVEDVIKAMCARIISTINTSFGSNDYARARDYLIALRKGAIDYEEASLFNAFMRSFKHTSLSSTTKRRDFWDNFVRGQDGMSLIRNDEALGERTGVDAQMAGEFINL